MILINRDKKKHTLIAWRKSHDNNILGVNIVWFRRNQLYHLIINDTGIRIINSAMTTQ